MDAQLWLRKHDGPLINLIGLLIVNDDMTQFFLAKLRPEYQIWVCIGNLTVLGVYIRQIDTLGLNYKPGEILRN